MKISCFSAYNSQKLYGRQNRDETEEKEGPTVYLLKNCLDMISRMIRLKWFIPKKNPENMLKRHSQGNMSTNQQNYLDSLAKNLDKK